MQHIQYQGVCAMLPTSNAWSPSGFAARRILLVNYGDPKLFMNAANRTISTILKHDNKQTSYKIALLRSINDVVLAFPDMQHQGRDVAIPLRLLAQYWLAYYWPFVNPRQPIMQGHQAIRSGKPSSDMAFRRELTVFRNQWETFWGGAQSPTDGFFIVDEMRVRRNREQYTVELISEYEKALNRIAKTIQMPIRYAGSGEWTVFDKPQQLSSLSNVTLIPGTQASDLCVVVKSELWKSFLELSLWIEALCIHEWCLFTERVEQPSETSVDRGDIYVLLTARPDNRRPLTWERNQIDLLLMEGTEFVCPWSERLIRKDIQYDIDHIVPLSIYPINELWNLVPSDPDFNSHKKRDRLPSTRRLETAKIHLVHTYDNYLTTQQLSIALREDVATRFVDITSNDYASGVAHAVIDFIRSVTDARNVAQF